MLLAHIQALTECACKIRIDPLGDHVLICKKHTGSIRGHNHLLEVLANLACSSKIGSMRVNHRVSTTGDGSRKQGDVENLPFPLAGLYGLVIDCSIACEFAGGSCADGGWRNGQLHTNDIFEAHARVKTHKYKDASALVQQAFSPAIVSVSGKIHRGPLSVMMSLSLHHLQKVLLLLLNSNSYSSRLLILMCPSSIASFWGIKSTTTIMHALFPKIFCWPIQMLCFCENTHVAFIGRDTPTPLISDILAQVDSTILEAQVVPHRACSSGRRHFLSIFHVPLLELL